MNTDKQLTDLFLQSAGLETDDNPDAITIGEIIPKDSEAGIAGVMTTHVKQIDFLLKALPENSPDAIKLFAARAVTFQEYQQLFNTKITERSFGDFVAFRYLMISREKQRLRLFNSLSPTYEDYCRFVVRCFEAYGYYRLPTFFFPESAKGSYNPQFSCSLLWSYWSRKIKAVRDVFFIYPTKNRKEYECKFSAV